MDDIKTAQANGLTIAYQSFGDPAARPLLLVMGLGTQMIGWPDGFCTMLADLGHHVVRFDNRDSGLSTHLDEDRPGQPIAAFLGRDRPAQEIAARVGMQPAYLISDMADDTAGLIQALDLESVHVVGVSMGGCISQSLAIRHPRLVRSLTSISSSTGSRRVGRPRLDIAARMLLRRRAANRAEAIVIGVATWRRIGSPGYPFNRERIEQLAGEAYDRRYDPAGGSRQLAAILASPDRTAALQGVAVPALVLHGEADPLITVSGGAATAAAIPGARLLTFPGMGHDLPDALWPRFVEEIAALVDDAEQRRTGERQSFA